jgi:hypothetical protein
MPRLLASEMLHRSRPARAVLRLQATHRADL